MCENQQLLIGKIVIADGASMRVIAVDLCAGESGDVYAVYTAVDGEGKVRYLRNRDVTFPDLASPSATP